MASDTQEGRSVLFSICTRFWSIIEGSVIRQSEHEPVLEDGRITCRTVRRKEAAIALSAAHFEKNGACTGFKSNLRELQLNPENWESTESAACEKGISSSRLISQV